MALPLTKPVILPLAAERRRHQRVRVNLLGRYMLADSDNRPDRRPQVRCYGDRGSGLRQVDHAARNICSVW